MTRNEYSNLDLEILGIICDKTGFRFTGQPHPENCREHHIRLVNESDVDRVLSTYRAIGTPEEIRAVIEGARQAIKGLDPPIARTGMGILGIERFTAALDALKREGGK